MQTKLTAFTFTLLATALFQAPVAIANTTNLHQRVEVAFVLDTTGSMADLIEGAKRKIWSIATTIVETNPDADIAMALVAYRDRGDAYVVKTEPLSEDIQGLYGKLIKLEADGGGDTPESVNEALDKAVKNLQWSTSADVKRIVFLVGDAPPHMDYLHEHQYPQIVKHATERGIIVNTVQAGDMAETTPIWQEIAQYGHGRYIAIPQSGGDVSIVITPYDDDILHLQMQLDSSVVPYGDVKRRADVTTKLREKAAAPKSVQIENSEYYSKRTSKREVVTGGGDLLADIENKAVEFDKITDKELPEALQTESKAARSAWVAEKLAQRQTLQSHMSDLMVKRDAFVAKQAAATAPEKAADSFDRAVADTLKTQLN
jgi:von Willebrand factor type A domain